MPQFDFTTYSSQIFWLLLCFTTLYLTLHFVILPRIHGIIAARKNVIDSDNSAATKLDEQIDEIHSKTEKLRQEASDKYQLKLDEVSKQALKEREKSVEELKEKIDSITKKSRGELKLFVEQANAKSAKAAEALVQTIKAKILN